MAIFRVIALEVTPPLNVFFRIILLIYFGVFLGAAAGAELIESSRVAPSPGPGFYDRPQSVTLPEGVRYTIDGGTPTVNSPVFDLPLRLPATTIVRYASFGPDGARTSPVHGATYFIDEPPTRLLTLSVGIDPWRLFNGQHGWFQAGHGADPGHWKKPGANWWTKREHPAHFDLLETDGKVVFSGTIGFRMFGGMSRLHPQKSFSLSARKKYGAKRIKHPVFGDEGQKSFRFLVARNAGSDWNRSYIRDALLTGLLQDESWSLERQAARPVQVYLNGRYWGIYHLREKINPRFLADRFPEVDKDKIDFLEHKSSLKHGSVRHYNALLDFVGTHDLSEPAHYRRLGEMMDIDNYQRLQIAQTYFDNRDAGGNIRFWRPRTPTGRWRWILYDVDQGFGLHQPAYERNTLEFYTEADGPSWPNPPWSTLLQRKLLANPTYARNFVNRSLDYLHTDFAPVTVAAAIEARVAGLELDMPRQLKRWRGKDRNWRFHLRRLHDFARERPSHLREHLRSYFTAGEDRNVEIAAGPGGYIVLNENLRIDERKYGGAYFQNLPLHLRVVAHKGFRFVGWEGVKTHETAFDLDLQKDRSYAVKAVFEPFDHPAAERVIINEIRPRGKADGDWIELYNRSDSSLTLKGWLLTDQTHDYRLPEVNIGPGDYLVVCREAKKLRRAHPTAHNVVEGLPFGLDKDGETLGLYGPNGGYINEVTYTIANPDTAFTYALVRPGLDNSDPRHWAQKIGTGTPCAANPDHLEASVITRQDYWLRIGVGIGVLILLTVVRTLKKDGGPEINHR